MRGAPSRLLAILFAAAYATLPATLWMLSPFQHLTAPIGPLGPWAVAWTASLLAVLAVVLPDRPPLPGLLAIATSASVAQAYGASHLDWSRLLKDWGLADGGAPSALGLALSGLALLGAFAWHLVDAAHLLRARYAAKAADARGVPRARARLRAQGGRLLLEGGGTLAAAALLFAVVHPLLAFLTIGDALLTPLVAGALLVAAALLALPGRDEPHFDG